MKVRNQWILWRHLKYVDILRHTDDIFLSFFIYTTSVHCIYSNSCQFMIYYSVFICVICVYIHLSHKHGGFYISILGLLGTSNFTAIQTAGL